MARGQVDPNDLVIGDEAEAVITHGSVAGMAYKCRGCGQTETIVEISLEPRIFGVSPEDGGPNPDFRLGIDETFVESEHVIGYGCMTEDCEFWQGNYPGATDTYIDEKDGLEYTRFRTAPTIEEVAEVVEV